MSWTGIIRHMCQVGRKQAEQIIILKQFRREFNEIWEEVDAVIDFFVADLEKLEAINKNVIYLII